MSYGPPLVIGIGLFVYFLGRPILRYAQLYEAMHFHLEMVPGLNWWRSTRPDLSDHYLRHGGDPAVAKEYEQCNRKGYLSLPAIVAIVVATYWIGGSTYDWCYRVWTGRGF